jgi:hypothetical protein
MQTVARFAFIEMKITGDTHWRSAIHLFSVPIKYRPQDQKKKSFERERGEEWGYKGVTCLGHQQSFRKNTILVYCGARTVK